MENSPHFKRLLLERRFLHVAVKFVLVAVCVELEVVAHQDLARINDLSLARDRLIFKCDSPVSLQLLDFLL